MSERPNDDDEVSVLHEAITFSSSDSVLGPDSWSVNVRATVNKLHAAGYRIVPASPSVGEPEQ